jgi:ornithine cyclodeaminase
MTTPSQIALYDAEAIRRAVSIVDVLQPVKASLAAYSAGQSLSPPISFIALENGGEVHLKSGYAQGADYFVTKIATMVAANRARGEATSDGLMLLCSAETGYPLALLHDRKYLTDIRTAAVGAIAAQRLAPLEVQSVGVLGTGGQALLQMQALALVRDFAEIHLWGRNPNAAGELAWKLRAALPEKKITIAPSAEQVVRSAQILVTTTASKEILVQGDWLPPGCHITALGADDGEKVELDAACFERAAFVACDSRQLALKFGDIAQGIKAGRLTADRIDAELGDLIAGRIAYQRRPGDITISKHVGIGIEDLFVAEACYQALTNKLAGG